MVSREGKFLNFKILNLLAKKLNRTYYAIAYLLHYLHEALLKQKVCIL